MINDSRHVASQLTSEVVTFPSDLEPEWASRARQSIYNSDGLLCGVDLYRIDIAALDAAGTDIREALERRDSTSGVGLFFGDRLDGALDYLLGLYDQFEQGAFTTLVFIDRIKASDAMYRSQALQDAMFCELAHKQGGSGFLCSPTSDLTCLTLAGALPEIPNLRFNGIGDPEPSPIKNDTSMFAKNQFAFLFEVDRTPSVGPKSPMAPVFLRPFLLGRALSVVNYPNTEMPGSRLLVGSELPGPRGVFVSRESLQAHFAPTDRA